MTTTTTSTRRLGLFLAALPIAGCWLFKPAAPPPLDPDQQLFQEIKLPASPAARLPNIHTAGDQIWISWVEPAGTPAEGAAAPTPTPEASEDEKLAEEMLKGHAEPTPADAATTPEETTPETAATADPQTTPDLKSTPEATPTPQTSASTASSHRLVVAAGTVDGFGKAVTITDESTLMMNWADFPSLSSARNGTLFAHWLRKIEGGKYAYTVQLARSTDGGNSWAYIGPAHTDTSPTEHGFVSMVPSEAKDKVRIIWLDGRLTESKGPMTLRTALVGEAVTRDELLDDRVCDCCGTDIAMSKNGPVVAFRDRLEGELRDITIARQSDDGWATTATLRDGWKIYGCPVNGPALDTRGNRVVAAWFTGAGDLGRIRVAFSRDGGETFGKVIDVETQTESSVAVGRVDVLLERSGSALVSWITHTNTDGSRIFLRRVSSDGSSDGPVVVAPTIQGRGSGFPRMAWVGNQIVMVWMDADGNGIRAGLLQP